MAIPRLPPRLADLPRPRLLLGQQLPVHQDRRRPRPPAVHADHVPAPDRVRRSSRRSSRSPASRCRATRGCTATCSSWASINIAIPFSLITFAEQTVDSSLAAMINGAVPLFVIVIAAIFLQGRDDHGQPGGRTRRRVRRGRDPRRARRDRLRVGERGRRAGPDRLDDLVRRSATSTPRPTSTACGR